MTRPAPAEAAPPRRPAPLPPHLERALNVLWAVLAVALAADLLLRRAPDQPPPELYAFVALHLEAAVLFLVRRSARALAPGLSGHLVALLSSGYFLLFDVDGGAALGPPWLGRAVLLAGCALVALAMASLGRAFGVLPARRGVRTGGAYRLVRHPLYAAYLVLDAGFLLGHATPGNLVVLLAGLGLYVLRIQAEERLLCAAAAYRRYRRRVRWRLLPGVW